MKGQLNRAIKFEICKITKSGKAATTFFAAFLVCCLILALVYVFTPSTIVKPPDVTNEQLLSNYEYRLAEYQQMISDPDCPSWYITMTSQEISRLTFFLQTGTTEYDYANFDEPEAKRKDQPAFGVAFFVLKYLKYIIYVAALSLTLYVFFGDISDNKLKNVLASKMPRGKIFDGKLVVSVGIPVIGTILASGILAIVMSTSPLKLLMYDGTHYYAVEPIALLSSIACGILLSVAVLAVVSAFVCMFFSHPMHALMTILGVLLLSICFAFIVEAKFAGAGSVAKANEALAWYPFANLPTLGNLGFDSRFFVTCACYLAAGVVLYFLAREMFKRKDF